MKSQSRSDLKAFFEPATIAVMGSLRRGTGLGYGTIKNMLNFGFNGRIYPVNPGYSELEGLKVYRNLGDVPDPVDLAVVITPASTVPPVVEECARKGIMAVIVISEHFAEAGDEGARLEKQLVDIARRTGIRIMGPNTIGVLNSANGLVTTPYRTGYNSVVRGGIAYCTQSGIAAAQTQALADRAYPISKMCDLANKCDINEVDMLNYLVSDPDTTVVAMHMEDVKDGRGFMDAARRIVRSKPLVIFKTARSREAARAARSHTGSLAGDYEVYAGVIKQVGAIGVDTWQEYWDVPRVLASQPLPRGNRAAIFVWSGGAGVVATDAAVKSGLKMAELSARTVGKLAGLTSRTVRNPVDISPMVSSAARKTATLQEEVIAAVMKDENVDCAFFAMAVMGAVPTFIARIDRIRICFQKPVVFWLYGPSLTSIEEVARYMQRQGIPVCTELETGVKALGILAGYSRFRSSGK